VPKRYDVGLELLAAHSTQFARLSWLDILFSLLTALNTDAFRNNPAVRARHGGASPPSTPDFG
jgi:hypothetical protein